MTAGPEAGPRPPRFWSLVARVLVRGAQREDIRDDLDRSHARDLEHGLSRRVADRRYRSNVLGSVWSTLAAGLRGFVTHGTLLDFKLGVRMLGRQPLLTAVSMLALGLGIPASLVVTHVFDVMSRPLPVWQGDRLMGIRYWNLERGAARRASAQDYEYWKESLSSFQSVGAARSYQTNVRAGEADAPPVAGAEVTASTFDMLRATPLLGRVLSRADEAAGAPDVILIGEDLWTARFAADPAIVGRVVRVGAAEHTIVGVMPSGFRFPSDDDVWLPLRVASADDPMDQGPELLVYGRLADGVSAEDAQGEMDLVTARAAADDPARLERLTGEVVDMPALLLGDSTASNLPALVILQSAMIVLLLIICGNVGTLLLARTASRATEISIRTALGASRIRIVTQLFIEALVLSLTATGLGLLAMEAVARVLARLLRPYGIIPYWVDPTLTPRTVFLALGFAILSATAAGVVPALKATSRKIRDNLRSAEAGSTVRFGRGSTALIVTEVVLSVGFLAVGSVMIRSVFQSTESTLGFEPARYVSASFRMPPAGTAALGDGTADEAYGLRVEAAQREVLNRLRTERGVVGAALAIHHPAVEGPFRRLVLESAAAEEVRLPQQVYEARVGVGYFSELGRPILAGRDFSEADLDETSGPRAVIVNTGFVRDELGGQNAVGLRFRYAGQVDATPESEEWFDIVGVVGPFGMNTLNPSHDAGYYLPIAPGGTEEARYLVEVAGEPNAFIPRFRAIVADVDPEATAEAQSLASFMRTESRVLRGLFSFIVFLAGVAFLLAVAGLYALMSFTVSQRTREIGIRTALGARASDIVATVARRAALQFGIGLTLGAGWGWFLLGQFTQQEIAVPTSKPLTLAVTLGCTALVGVVACLRPTLRGLRIQPTEALRDL